LAVLVGPGGAYQGALGVSWDSFIEKIRNSIVSRELKSAADAYYLDEYIARQGYPKVTVLADSLLHGDPDDNLWLYCQTEKVLANVYLGKKSDAKSVLESIKEQYLQQDSITYRVLMEIVNTDQNHGIAESGALGKTRSNMVLGDHLPKTYQLSQNYPNPFNPFSTIQY